MSEIKYWNSLEQLNEDPAFLKSAEKEFQEEVPVEEFLGKEKLSDTTTSRRDFLKFMGFSLGAATLAACETPVTRSIPYIVKPEEITPGVANWYASTYSKGGSFASILVKTREGRPIFIQPNDRYPAERRGVSSRVNASVLELYDDNRYMAPQKAGANTSWDNLDADIASKLMGIKAKGGSIRVLTSTVNGPGAKASLKAFSDAFATEGEQDDYNEKGEVVGKIKVNGGVEIVTYDAINNSAMIQANKGDFGLAAMPSYAFGKSKVIVSLGADFLGDWGDGTTNSVGYASTRNPSSEWMSKHFQFETNMSRTGASADIRGAIRPSDMGAATVALYNAIASMAGAASINGAAISDDDNGLSAKISNAASALWNNRGNCLVVSGSTDVNVQKVVNGINQMLGNYGSTITWSNTNNISGTSEDAILNLMTDMNAGKVEAIIIRGSNPAYSIPGFSEAMAKVSLKVSMADRPDETSVLCNYVAPNHYFLEGWNDFEPYTGLFTMSQPCIKPLFKTRQAEDSFLTWAGSKDDFYATIRNAWEKEVFPNQKQDMFFDSFWNRAVQDGVAKTNPVEVEGNTPIAYNGDAASAAAGIKSSPGTWECQFYFKQSIGDGSQANNPHLQEMPDGISKISWDNYVTMSPKDMNDNGWETKTAEQTPANLVNVAINGKTISLPVVSSPGQKVGTIGIALGYGRETAGRMQTVGQNAFQLLSSGDSGFSLSATDVAIADAGSTYAIASVQTHHTMMGRKIVNETSLSTFNNFDKNDEENGWNKDVLLSDAYGEKKSPRVLNLWQDHGIEQGHHWGMSIDLNACNSCGACITACHFENNVPVVGKDEIRRTRSMFWLRVDRYYSSDMTKARGKEEGVGVTGTYEQMEDPSVYPQVSFQPVMCHHCNHAPCETVCPVAATNHSEEGLNQMAYNRCIGTRYCANNCPYKVRRFNWFNYQNDPKFADVSVSNNELARMVLNPDVIVRSRGVIEKCSFCVQKIQAGKLVAKKAGRPVQDGDVVSACAGACATGAIKFGDLNDAESMVSNSWKDDRSYFLIEEVGTQPNVAYMTKVRNNDTKA